MRDSVSILLVDDDKISRYITRNMLNEISASKGQDFFTIQELNHGQAAVAYLQESKDVPSLVLLDLNMPYMDGFEFLHWLRANELYTEIKVVVCTTSLMKYDKKRINELGVQGYFVKPLNKEQLKQCIALVAPNLV